jgi:hypothetical protein
MEDQMKLLMKLMGEMKTETKDSNARIESQVIDTGKSMVMLEGRIKKLEEAKAAPDPPKVQTPLRIVLDPVADGCNNDGDTKKEEKKKRKLEKDKKKMGAALDEEECWNSKGSLSRKLKKDMEFHRNKAEAY